MAAIHILSNNRTSINALNGNCYLHSTCELVYQVLNKYFHVSTVGLRVVEIMQTANKYNTRLERNITL